MGVCASVLCTTVQGFRYSETSGWGYELCGVVLIQRSGKIQRSVLCVMFRSGSKTEKGDNKSIPVPAWCK